MHGFGDETTNRVDKAVRVGTSLPSTCHRGELFFLVGATNKIYASFAVDTWTEIANSVALTPAFSVILAGTNAAALVVGTGGSLAPSGSGTIQATLLSGAALITTAAVPADGSLAASQMRLWLDPTNGAGKLMIKAKTADGTVVTGSVNLT